eukprot:gnl/TRDRNA2_/TRDRNA2_173609_c5_seq1.p2 gnl/TRDRNA2_/TRDRNA2_173609_c5~~gnl/TRDRNA2_/TRDRNA2_173609_c5_seq1.p2  ORF type:complete len:151 (-),score=14.68 gnl/TRDRNA2_/TRDRNA2_173609_c5_seq1:158-610(-)
MKGRLPVPSCLCGTFGAAPQAVSDALSANASLLGSGRFRDAHRQIPGADLPWTSIDLPSRLRTENTKVETCNDDLIFKNTDGVWLGNGLSALAALAGHRQTPCSGTQGRLCRATFPADHLPLVVALEHELPSEALPSSIGFLHGPASGGA